LLVARVNSLLNLCRPATSPEASDISNSAVHGSKNRPPATGFQSSGVDDIAIEIALQTLDRVFSEMNRGARDAAKRYQSVHPTLGRVAPSSRLKSAK
jgi:hypothetical protein